jgi:hypothetical protein
VSDKVNNHAPFRRYRIELNAELELETDSFLELARAYERAVKRHEREAVAAFDGDRRIVPGPSRLAERFPL